MSKSPRAPLGDLPVPAIPSPAGDSRFADAEKLETAEAVVAGIASGRITTVNPRSLPSVEKPKRQAAAGISFSLKIPEHVRQQLKLAAVQKNQTIRMTLLLALRDAGYTIHDEDLIDARQEPT